MKKIYWIVLILILLVAGADYYIYKNIRKDNSLIKTDQQKYGTSDKEPLLLLAEERFIFCQNGKTFREMPSYPERNIFYFVTQLDQSKINQIKNLMGSKEINFSGAEYEIPKDILPEKYPDACAIEYNGCCDGTKKINYGDCEKYHKNINKFIKDSGFNVEKNYKTLIEVSIDKGMTVPVVDNDYALQIKKLCALPIIDGKPSYDNIKWKVGVEKNNTFRFYSDIAVEPISASSKPATDEATTRDKTRVSDITLIRTALELYFMDFGKFPDKIEPGKPLTNSGVIYSNKIPSNPLPNDGSCPTDYQYKYSQQNNGKSYELEFCLGEASGKFNININKVGP